MSWDEAYRMRVLVVEDEEKLADLVARMLKAERFDVDVALDGPTGLERAMNASFDAVVLDRMLPGMDGLEVCRRLRSARVMTPVLVLTARRELNERVQGLDAGADDYLGKPFAFSELLARLRALTRRGERPLLASVLRVGDLTLDQQTHRVERGGQEVDLSPREFALLEYLMRNAGQVLTRDQILQRVWGYESEPEGNVVDLYVHYLRKKLKDSGRAAVIRTVRGVGYVARA
ncbi:MAG TPA: response regulator transcription factor [Thermomicrobiaceae bacterium]|nr:response regulator transcription factor [Thermomicrobiaceae bacterium]